MNERMQILSKVGCSDMQDLVQRIAELEAEIKMLKAEKQHHIAAIWEKRARLAEAKITELEAASEFDHKEYLRLRNEQKAKIAELEARIIGIKTIAVWNLDSAYKDVKRPNATTMIVLLTDLKKFVDGEM